LAMQPRPAFRCSKRNVACVSFRGRQASRLQSPARFRTIALP
jgi:hypothetical protein